MAPTDGQDTSRANVGLEVESFELLNEGLGTSNVPCLLSQHGVLKLVVSGSTDSSSNEGKGEKDMFVHLRLIL